MDAVSASEAEEGGGCCIEAETEEETVLVLVLERTLGIGMVLETVQRKKKDDGLGRRAIKGKALRNRDMLLCLESKCIRYPVKIYRQRALKYSEPKQKIQT